VTTTVLAPPARAGTVRWYGQTPEALGLYRVLYALGSLALWRPVPSEALSSIPDAFFFPPAGPIQLLSGFPSAAVLTALEAGALSALVALLLGYRTHVAGIAFGVLSILQCGLRYSTGKIDHELLIVLVPVVLAWSGWGDRFSVDEWRHGRPHRRRRPSARPIAVLALLVGATFAASGAAKTLTGWLDPRGSAVWGWAVTYQDYGWPVNDVNRWLVPRYVPALWEAMDVATVLFELGFLVAALSGRWFRPYLVLALGFHIGILLVFGIDFSRLLLLYLAFAPLHLGQSDAVRTLDRVFASLAKIPGAFLAVAAVLVGTAVQVWDVPTLLAALSARVPLPFGTGLWLLTASLLACGIAFALRRQAARPIDEPATRPLPRWLRIAATLAIVSPFLVLVRWSEPYPALVGPLFTGVRAEGGTAVVLRQDVWVQGPGGRREVQPEQLFRTSANFGDNLQNYRFPPPLGAAQAYTPFPDPPAGRLGELGHRFRPTRFNRPPVDLTQQERSSFAEALDAQEGDMLIVQWTRALVRPDRGRLVDVQSSVVSDQRWPLA
jgi:hypothetical protein